MAEVLGRRASNKLERRRRLERVALELFEKDGFEATTIERITDAAGLSARTFFSYFASKDDLVLADYAERLNRILSELADRPRDERPWDALEAAFASVAADYVVEADQIRRRFAIMVENPSVLARSLQLQLGWEAALTVALRTRLGVGPEDRLPQLLAASALAITRASLQHWLTVPGAPPLPLLVQDGFERLARGFGPS